MLEKRISLSILCLFVTHLVFAIQGELSGVFSVSPTKKVRFSQGNLQFNAALGTHQCADGTTRNGTWRFALNQYDIVGETANNNRSETYNGWIDTYCWGTSGWNSGAKYYQPWTKQYLYGSGDFMPGGDRYADLSGEYVSADWGVYNAISNAGNKHGLWRLLTYEEWNFLLKSRTNAQQLYYFATVNKIPGMVLLPDNWFSEKLTIPQNATNINNPITIEEWYNWEKTGAVFIPYSQYVVRSYGSDTYVGYCWSATHSNSSDYYYGGAYALRFSKAGIGPTLNYYMVDVTSFTRGTLCYVRLVRDFVDETYNISVEPNNADFGTTTGGTTAGSLGEQLTISATPNECYLFYNWSDGNTDNPRSITIEGDATYIAVFVKQQYTVTATADNAEQGSVSITAE